MAEVNTRLQLFIDKRRRELGISSQRELARLMGRNETAISKIINRGSTAPTAELVRDLAGVLRVPIEEIFWALGLTETRPAENKKIAQQELMMIYDHLDGSERENLVKYAEFLLASTKGSSTPGRNEGPDGR